jgi:DNA-directed RNA polymerase I, II, and III subunit RPABC2
MADSDDDQLHEVSDAELESMISEDKDDTSDLTSIDLNEDENDGESLEGFDEQSSLGDGDDDNNTSVSMSPDSDEEEDDDSTSLPSGIQPHNTILSTKLPDNVSDDDQTMVSPSSTPLVDSDDSDDDSDDEALDNKFEIEGLNEYLANYHPESKQHNYDEIYALSKVVRDANGIIVDDLHRTLPIMSKYEKTRILGQRAKQLNSGNKPFISVPKNIMDGYLIAQEELRQKKLPFIIRRPLPNGGSEYWRIKDLEILY